MGYKTGFRKPGWDQLSESVRERFWEAVGSGLSPTAAATVAGMSGATGRRWVQQAGYQTNPKHFGIRYCQQVKDTFWESVRSGMRPTDAAVVAGVSEHTGRRWVEQAGYVPRTPVSAACEPGPEPESRPQAMTFVERCRLEEVLEAGHSEPDAADRLHRHRSTIYREVRRGATDSGYRAWAGQAVVDANRARPKPRKLESNPVLLAEVLQRLEQRHSPEQITGRLREEFPDDPEMWVSPETIYQAMYVQPRGELARQVKAALRTGRTQRKPQGRKHIEPHERFKDMINISERPAEADDRAIPGHWEGDLILGAGNESAIGTLVERTTGFVMLLHLPSDHTAATVADAMTAKIPEIPEVLRRSLTWDQGSEMALHTKITEATGLPIYFCDPHSPWQR
ncbi:MAG: IS30 family transposase, partial [Pseudonocardiaceae bacterium]